MHQEEWDSATLTKLDIFEQYVHKWLDVVVNDKKVLCDTVEIYDLFCGTGFDGTKTHKGSPLRILDVVAKRNLKNKKVKLYFNDAKSKKVEKLKAHIQELYPHVLDDERISIKYTNCDVMDYKLLSQKYYKLILLDQYGIKHIGKIEEYLKGGVDILLFISSWNVRRFCEDNSFKKYINIPKKDFDNKTPYETHRVIVSRLQQYFDKAFVSPFTLLKDNKNINGLVFFSTHPKGQEQFLKTAWKVDENFGEGNCNIEGDYEKDKNSLFYNPDTPSQKLQKFEEDLKTYLEIARNNKEIRQFSYNCGFLTTHAQEILEKIKNNLEIMHYNGSIRGFHLKDKDKKVTIRLKGANEENKN